MRLTDEQRELVEKNQWLAVWFAKRWRSHRNHFDDIQSEAYRGLCRAAITWTPTLGSFSTHVNYWMYNYVSRYIRSVPIVRTPEYLHGQQNREPEGRHRFAAHAIRNFSASAVGSAALPWIDSGQLTPLAIAESNDDLAWLKGRIECLDERPKGVVRRRLAGESLVVIGGDMGVSRERVKQIETEAIRTLRDSKPTGGAACGRCQGMGIITEESTCD